MNECGEARACDANEDALVIDIDMENEGAATDNDPVASIDVEAVAPKTDTNGQLQPVSPAIAEDMQESMGTGESDDTEEDEILVVLLVFIVLGAVFATLDWRSLRATRGEQITFRSDLYVKLKAQRSQKSCRKTLRCSPDSFDSLQSFLEPMYYKKYGLPGKNTQYDFDFGLGVLLTYYGNGCGQDGDGIGGAAAQLGMSRPAACRYIKNL
ncbi:hypothetical protein PHMEG_00023090 [Phytophthora megakarya]|uniref:Uncharacterized protein n=1 Tax=Phytophthora megakarya TaxID=4795 RepID=A0A225VK65_9STRA|nr:hypothetical protein PHMEG_00023090 [Phytophthora megakarya]